MELSKEDFWAVVGGLEAQPDTEEMRRASRVMLRRLVTVVPEPPVPGGELVGVRLRDVSRGGVCILHHQGMPKGKQFVLRLPRAGAPELSVRCTVRHCEMVRQDVYAIGAEFSGVGGTAGPTPPNSGD